MELVVVRGSANEFYTEGAYASGDLDLCVVPPSTITLRQRQEMMGRLGAEGGPRSWRVAGMFVDLLGECEYFANTQRQLMNGILPPVKRGLKLRESIREDCSG